MLPLRWQEPNICVKVQKVPQRPDAPEEQDTGCQEVRKGSTLFTFYIFKVFVLVIGKVDYGRGGREIRTLDYLSWQQSVAIK